MNYIDAAVRSESTPNMAMAERATKCLRPSHACAGLTTETGELTDVFKRHIYYDAPLDMTNIKEEIGDVFWYLAILCDWAGVSFEECQAANIAKLKKRYPEKFDSEQAVNRDLAAERGAIDGIPQAIHADVLASEKESRERFGPSPLGPSFSKSPARDEYKTEVIVSAAESDPTDFPTDGGWKNKPDATPEFSELGADDDPSPPQTKNCPNCHCSALRPSSQHPGKQTCNQCGHHF